MPCPWRCQHFGIEFITLKRNLIDLLRYKSSIFTRLFAFIVILFLWNQNRLNCLWLFILWIHIWISPSWTQVLRLAFGLFVLNLGSNNPFRYDESIFEPLVAAFWFDAITICLLMLSFADNSWFPSLAFTITLQIQLSSRFSSSLICFSIVPQRIAPPSSTLVSIQWFGIFAFSPMTVSSRYLFSFSFSFPFFTLLSLFTSLHVTIVLQSIYIWRWCDIISWLWPWIPCHRDVFCRTALF